MRKLVERIGLRALRLLDPETAHGVALKALNMGLAGGSGPVTSARLRVGLAGIDLPNPIGVAAGFDKNASAVDAVLKTGFGFCEIGAVTPRPQPGNARPRLFRLAADRAAINRFGFNNQGMDQVLANLSSHRRNGIVGVNLGANKDTPDKAEDFIAVLRTFHTAVDFATVNVSSPNTERLRDLQVRAALEDLLNRVLEARSALPTHVPIFLKIAPDLSDADLTDIAEISLAQGVDAIIATNTTVAREELKSPLAKEAGGLSGAPLFQKSTAILAALFGKTRGRIPLIGVGGIASAEDAYAKIRAGASAVQLYTAMVYDGIGLGAEIARGLDDLMMRDGVSNIIDIVGADAGN
ncbi:MAG: quinone-dependent dihydroorotate dehydrogenase [Pseudomonadota bacterium]